MRWLALSVALVALAPAGSALASAPGPINAVVGDASWIARHGRRPSPRDDEAQRIRTHLEWVESRLRAKDVSHLPPRLRARRARLLDALGRYAARGRFPEHDEHRDRRPRFIDHEGRLCAVGHLVAVTAGRDVAEAIDARHEYAYLLDIHSERLQRWIAWSGFTPRELAMIQPQYGWRDPGPVARPAPPPTLEQRLAGIEREVRGCVRRHVPWAAVTVRAHVRLSQRGTRIRIASFPYRAGVEACAARLVRRAVSRVSPGAAGRTLAASHAWHVAARRPAPPDRPHVGPPPLSTPRVRRMARGALDPHRHRMLACLDLERTRGTVTLRGAVGRDGRLRLEALRVPAGTSQRRLRCIASIVHARRIAARPQKRISFVYRLSAPPRPQPPRPQPRPRPGPRPRPHR